MPDVAISEGHAEADVSEPEVGLAGRLEALPIWTDRQLDCAGIE